MKFWSMFTFTFIVCVSLLSLLGFLFDIVWLKTSFILDGENGFTGIQGSITTVMVSLAAGVVLARMAVLKEGN
ncbi:hypothetical protein ACKA06_00150 [Rossellomorea oryzaecorticis]|uniref:Uncharacterized protein n=1 Tax=Rossellomorea oryzaecorticis TaxID=1396505 RepID=A0ABW8VIC6_9BACI